MVKHIYDHTGRQVSKTTRGRTNPTEGVNGQDKKTRTKGENTQRNNTQPREKNQQAHIKDSSFGMQMTQDRILNSRKPQRIKLHWQQRDLNQLEHKSLRIKLNMFEKVKMKPRTTNPLSHNINLHCIYTSSVRDVENELQKF